ncbi:MAG TPA: outer membrane lipoprotein carrier protein LolA [Myxococcota bacterium]|jgi:hypothetical protein
MSQSKLARGMCAGNRNSETPEGGSRRARRWARLLCGLAALTAAAGRADDAGDAQLAARIARLRAPGEVEREFVETKRLALLREPVESRGVMAFAPPDRLRWEILAPEPSRLRVEGARVSFERAGARARQLDLTLEPGARGLVDAVRFLLAGDLAALRRSYEVTLAEDGDAWRLALAPRDEAERRVVSRIELAGAGDAARELWLHFANGDLSYVAFAEPR